MEHAVGRAGTQVAPSSAVGRDASAQRIVGLDSIRFVCAFIVLVDHLGLTPDRIHGQSLRLLDRVLSGTYNSLFNGPETVIVFFVIIGFCIHFPCRDGWVPELASTTLGDSSGSCPRWLELFALSRARARSVCCDLYGIHLFA